MPFADEIPQDGDVDVRPYDPRWAVEGHCATGREEWGAFTTGLATVVTDPAACSWAEPNGGRR